MAVSGIENGHHHHLHEDFQNSVNQSGTNDQGAKRAGRNSDRGSEGNSDSQFTPSAASQGQDSEGNGGTYQVTQVEVFSAAALVLLGQPGTSSSAQAAVAPTPASTQTAPTPDSTATALAPTQTVISPSVSPIVSAATPQAVPQAVTASPVSSTAATTGDASGTSTQDPLQALNNALQSLGLSPQQIQEFDQVASFINSVSPAAFTDLSNQLQALAQQVSQGGASAAAPVTSSDAATSPDPTSTATLPTAASSSGTPTTTGTAAATPATPSATPPAGTYQIEALSIQFSGFDVQGTTGSASGSSGTSGTFDVSAFNLSIQEVNLTLTDGNGNSAQITTPSSSGNSNPTTTQSSGVVGATAS